jgi:hypothetical protein
VNDRHNGLQELNIFDDLPPCSSERVTTLAIKMEVKTSIIRFIIALGWATLAGKLCYFRTRLAYVGCKGMVYHLVRQLVATLVALLLHSFRGHNLHRAKQSRK